MGIKSDIFSNLITTLESITIAEGYSLDIKCVDKQRALLTDKLSAYQKQAAIAVTFGRESKFRKGESIYANDQLMFAVAQFYLRIVMENATPEQCLDFMEDIEAVLSKDESRGGLTDENYIVTQTWISDIDMVELIETNVDRLQEAIITVNVGYSYIPLTLSGDADRLG